MRRTEERRTPTKTLRSLSGVPVFFDRNADAVHFCSPHFSSMGRKNTASERLSEQLMSSCRQGKKKEKQKKEIECVGDGKVKEEREKKRGTRATKKREKTEGKERGMRIKESASFGIKVGAR